MTGTILAALLLVVAGILFCVSALESALSALREHRVSTISDGDARLASRLKDYLDSKNSRLGQALILSAICNASIAALGLLLFRRLLPATGLQPLPLGLLIFGSIVLLCHLAPNLLANLRPHFVFAVIAPPVAHLSALVAPFEKGLQCCAGAMTNVILPISVQPTGELQDEELDTLVEMRRDEGAFDDLEGEVIHEILKLGDKTAKDCMTPRVDADSLDLSLPAPELMRRIGEQRHRLLPAYEGSPDEIVGVLDVVGFLHSEGGKIKDHLRPATFVPETMGAIELFQQHLEIDDQLVIVLDEFGGFEGIVTRADVIDDLVADAAPAEDVEIQALGNGRFLVSGSARLDDLGDITREDLQTDADGLDTIGGLLATRLGRIPLPGETVILEGFDVSVRKSTTKRVEELLLVVRSSHREEGAGE